MDLKNPMIKEALPCCCELTIGNCAAEAVNTAFSQGISTLKPLGFFFCSRQHRLLGKSVKLQNATLGKNYTLYYCYYLYSAISLHGAFEQVCITQGRHVLPKDGPFPREEIFKLCTSGNNFAL